MVFDKTGTLTRGEFRVVDVVTDGSLSANDALRIAAAVGRDSEHTLGLGIVLVGLRHVEGEPITEHRDGLRAGVARAHEPRSHHR